MKDIVNFKKKFLLFYTKLSCLKLTGEKETFAFIWQKIYIISLLMHFVHLVFILYVQSCQKKYVCSFNESKCNPIIISSLQISCS